MVITTSKWKILNKYDFELLPGEPQQMPDGDYSYYQYLNKRWQETGKNVLCQEFLLSPHKRSKNANDLIVAEPFGGCGVFSIAIQHLLKPMHHFIGELDEDCVRQLYFCTSSYPGVTVHQEDAHERLGVLPADIYVCDFPFFTLIKHSEQNMWVKEMERMVSHEPEAIIITDGSSCRWHFTANNLKKRGYDVNHHRESYAKVFDKYFKEKYNYRVTAVAYHGTCFYIKIQPARLYLDKIAIKHIPAGVGINGLRPQ